MKSASNSHVAMLKGAIALAWADLSLNDNEVALLQKYVECNIHLSAEQKQLLLDEIRSPQRMIDIWPHITDKHDRAHLINIAHMVFWQDGVFSHTEREVFDRIEKEHLATLNTAELEKDIKQMCEEAMARIDREERNRIDALSPAARFFYYLEKRVGLA